MSVRCALANLITERTDPEQIKRDGWREQSILVVSAEDRRLDWVERQTVRNIGNRLYGKSDRENALG